MDVTETLHVVERAVWRAWLAANYAETSEIWLVYPRKHTGRPRIAYSDAVEEALCFGWIDGQTKGIDEDEYAQRFTPRRARSSYSQTNIERLRRLHEQGRLQPEVATAVADVIAQEFEWPEDIMAALQADPEAWANFQRYSPAYRRIRVAYVDDGRKRPGQFEKRLANLVAKSAQDKQFGFGIDAFY